MRKSLLYVFIMVASLSVVMCTPKQEAAVEADTTKVEAVQPADSVEAQTDSVSTADTVEVK